jgi:hypothetical protein
MPFISAIVEVVDANGDRVDLPVNGIQQPIVLKIGDNIVPTSRDRGDGTTEVALAVSFPSPPPTPGWKTLLDTDFTVLTNQSLHTDGVVTLSDGSHWTKSGSAQDDTGYPWAIVNGTGLVTSGNMAGVDGFASGVLTAPTLWPNLLLGTLSGVGRLPVRISSIYEANPDDHGGAFGTSKYGIALEARDTSARVIASVSRYASWNTLVYLQNPIVTHYESENAVSGANNVGIGAAQLFTPEHNCLMLECPSGLLLGQALSFSTYSATNAFPAGPWTCLGVTPNPTAALNTLVDNPAVWTTDNWHPAIINSMNHTSTGHAVVTRFKVEAFF